MRERKTSNKETKAINFKKNRIKVNFVVMQTLTAFLWVNQTLLARQSARQRRTAPHFKANESPKADSKIST